MHGRGSRAIVHASNAVGRGDAGGTPPDRVSVPHWATSCHVDFPTHADVAQIGPTQAISTEIDETAEIAGSSRNSRVRPKFKKINKKVQNAPFELNLKP